MTVIRVTSSRECPLQEADMWGGDERPLDQENALDLGVPERTQSAECAPEIAWRPRFACARTGTGR